MSGEVRKGERIPRRDPPPYEEADGFGQAVARDGFLPPLSTIPINTVQSA